MLRLLDRRHAPAVPKSYNFPGGPSIPWESGKKTFQEFVQAVQAFAQGNGKLIPPIEEIEHQICTRLAKGWCTEQTRFDRPPSRINVAKPVRAGCKTCGRRRL